MVLQVYRSLLRDTAERSTVRAALDILLPALSARLGRDELDTALKYSLKVMTEDAGSIQQMAHLWETVTTHSRLFARHKSEITPHLLPSLLLLGSHPHPPVQLTRLVVALAKLILDWAVAGQDKEASQPTTPRLGRDALDTVVNVLLRLAFANAAKRPNKSYSAAGGVGLEADQYAHFVGAEVYATASRSKHEYLQSIGIVNMSTSRDEAVLVKEMGQLLVAKDLM